MYAHQYNIRAQISLPKQKRVALSDQPFVADRRR